MQYQPEIHTISKMAPPSYAEAMGHPTVSQYEQHAVPSPNQQTLGQHPQMSCYPSPAPPYHSQSNFYPEVGAQPAYNPAYVPTPPLQETGTQLPRQDVIHHTIIRAPPKRPIDRCCNKRVVIGCISFIFILYIIKVMLLLTI